MESEMIPKSAWPEFFTGELETTPVVVILRGLSETEAVATARKAWAAGVRLVEVTVETDSALPVLEAVARAAPDGVRLGAGTVTTPSRLTRSVDAGAGFAVAPGLDEDTVHAADELGVPLLPGVATPTEAGHAERLGVSVLKAFPAATLGADWVRALAGPYPRLRFVATGGVRANTATDYLRAGALAVGVGGSVAHDGLDELVAAARTH